MKKQYTLNYINEYGSTVAREYFDNIAEAISFMENVIKRYECYNENKGLILDDENGKVIMGYEPIITHTVYHDNDRLYPLADELVSCFSEFLEQKGIMFLNEDTDEFQLKNKLAIYGEDFRTLQDMVQYVLNKRIKK